MPSPNVEGLEANIREQVRMMNKAVKQSQYFTTVEKQKVYERKGLDGLESINSKRGHQFGSQPVSMLEQHDF